MGRLKHAMFETKSWMLFFQFLEHPALEDPWFPEKNKSRPGIPWLFLCFLGFFFPITDLLKLRGSEIIHDKDQFEMPVPREKMLPGEKRQEEAVGFYWNGMFTCMNVLWYGKCR